MLYVDQRSHSKQGNLTGAAVSFPDALLCIGPGAPPSHPSVATRQDLHNMLRSAPNLRGLG